MTPALLALLLLLAAVAQPAAAQQSKCADCAGLSEQEMRRLESEIRALSRELARQAETRDEAETSEERRAAERAMHRTQMKLDRLAHRLAGRQMKTAMRGSTSVPTGWMGVNFVGPMSTRNDGQDVTIRHFAYPTIASVEPGSPAERAGLEAGDTILAFDARDLVRHEISLTRLLQPGKTVKVRLKREGRSRELPVVITQRPHHAWDGRTHPGHGMLSPVRSGGRPDGARGTVVLGDVSPAPPVPALPPNPMVFGTGTSAVAGAEVVRLNEELGEVFGVERGVLVLNVGAGTPAARAGLRGGDVIVSAEGSAVTTPAAVQRIMRRDEDRAITLSVVRKRTTESIELRW